MYDMYVYAAPDPQFSSQAKSKKTKTKKENTETAHVSIAELQTKFYRTGGASDAGNLMA